MPDHLQHDISLKKVQDFMKEFNAILTIAQRDFVKFLRDRGRIIATFVFPFIFIGVLGGSLQSNLAADAGYNFLEFIFAGVLGQTLFQSTASGIISLIEDRENDFSQEIFVSPISRYSIIVGKILGESLVAMVQIIGILAFGLILGVPISFINFVTLIPFFLIVCMLGGAFGIFCIGSLSSQRSANQLFPFLMFPQFFLAGVFSPIQELPLPLLILSRIVPMTYAVDLIRSVYYAGTDAYEKTVLFSTSFNLLIIGIYFTVCLLFGTYFFIRNERNK
jgi:ABC-2 type transport system permease protein